jgi:N-acetylmuramoyl-L-alanine amidase
MSPIWRPSPNFDSRRPGAAVSLLVLHYTGMRTGEEAMAWLTNPASKVSSHYTVEEDGTVFQHVDEAHRAWHAGKSFWRGERDNNAVSVGIEIVNPGHEFGYRPFPEAQIAAVAELSQAIVARHGIAPTGVAAHSDVAPARKQDPGELFPWKRLAAAGVGLWPTRWRRDGGPPFGPGARGARIRPAQHALAVIGYACAVTGVMDQATTACVLAFQRRFRQRLCDGVLDGETRGLIHAVARMCEQGA